MTTSKKIASKAGSLLPKSNTPQKTKGPIASALVQAKRSNKKEK